MCSRRALRRRRGSSHRSSRRRRRVADRARRQSGPCRSRERNDRTACRSRQTLSAAAYVRARPAASSGASRNGTRSSSTLASPVVRTILRRRRTAARADRPSSANADHARPARATSAARRLRRTVGRRRASRCALREVGPRERQRHDVLQLIAEAEGAARLVVAGARPQAAARCPDIAATH